MGTACRAQLPDKQFQNNNLFIRIITFPFLRLFSISGGKNAPYFAHLYYLLISAESFYANFI
jgi:hypothetical protein